MFLFVFGWGWGNWSGVRLHKMHLGRVNALRMHGINIFAFKSLKKGVHT